MTRGGNRGKVLPPTFPPFPPRLEIPQKTRASHIPTATTTAGLLLPPELNPQSLKKPNPSKIKGPVGFSCRALIPGIAAFYIKLIGLGVLRALLGDLLFL